MIRSKESELDVLALGYDHFRILRDSAHRASDYLERVIKRGGKALDEKFWLSLPEPTSTISLRDMNNAMSALLGELVIEMADIKEQAAKIVGDLKLERSVDNVLYTLAQSQRSVKLTEKDLEKEWEDRDSVDELSELDELNMLPALGPNQQYEYTGKKGSPEEVWKIIDLVQKGENQKEKTTFSLKRRPKK